MEDNVEIKEVERGDGKLVIGNDLEYEDEHGKIIIKKHEHKFLPLAHGYAVIIKKRPGLTLDMIDALADSIGELGIKCVVIVVGKLSDVKVLDPEMMDRYGWIPKQQSE